MVELAEMVSVRCAARPMPDGAEPDAAENRCCSRTPVATSSSSSSLLRGIDDERE